MNAPDRVATNTVGLIGLGAMGRGVAANLARKGFRVFGCDVREDSRAALAASDRFTTRAADLGAECDIVVSFVVNDAQTEAVLFGEDGLAATMRAGSVFVACSTMPPAYVQALAPRLAAKGISLLDAPVTGGAVGAAKGTLTIMAAGPKAAFERAKVVLEAFGARVHHLSEANGAGCQMKVINQLLCGVHLAAAAEALALAKAQGLPLGPTLEILTSGAAHSWMLGDRGPRMATHDFGNVTSAVDIFVKDLSLVLDATRATKFPAPLAHAAYMAFLATSARGQGGQDDSAVITDYELRTGGDA